MGAAAINADLNKIQSWADTWLVTFSPPKTEEIIISNKEPRYHPVLKLNGQNIKNVTSHKHLGLHFSNDLKWTIHIREIAKKAINHV